MIKLFEALFDIAYLGLMIGIGIRLLLEENKKAKFFGIMAMLLGSGDAFHLLPRVVSHLTVNGFEQNIAFLSWGEFVTGMTMTIFYLMFYHYYQDLSGDHHKHKKRSIYLLAMIRIGIILLPQNLWGTAGNYIFGILRNIPFLIMGILLINWTYQFKEMDGLKHCSLLIFLSFLFYIPVVIGAKFIPILGAFMIPKTIAYVLLVLEGFKYYVKSFQKGDLIKTSITFLILGLTGGVFYREFTKLYHFTDQTTLSLVHLHLIVLGFLFPLTLYGILKSKTSDIQKIQKSFLAFCVGLAWMITTFVVKGINAITSGGHSFYPAAAFSGIAGIGHIILGTSMIILMLKMKNIEQSSNAI